MKPWSGYHLRVTAVHFRPYCFPVTNPTTGEVRIHGLVGAILDNVTAAMNMTYSVFPPSDGQYGLVDEETEKMIGMPQMILEGSADLVACPFPVHPIYFKYLHFVANLKETVSGFGIITGMTKEYIDSPASFTDAFNADTWLCILCGFIAVHLMFFLHNIFISKPKSITPFDAFTKWLFEMFGVILQEATSERPPKLWFERLVLGLWLITCMLLSYTFLGAMRANLIVLTPTLRINDLSELLEHPQLTLYIGVKTPSENLIKEVKGEVGRRFNEHLKQNSEGILGIEDFFGDKIRDSVAQRRGAVLMEEKFMRIGISKWCVESPYSFYIAKTPIRPLNSVVLSSKALPADLRRDFDKNIMWIQAYDVPFMREKELLMGTLDCLASTDMKTSESMKAVQVRDLNVILISLGIGYACAFIMFLIEICHYRLKHIIMNDIKPLWKTNHTHHNKRKIVW